MLNKVTLIGNLGRDPEIRSQNNGDTVTNLALATNDRWTYRETGEKKERTEWHRVVIFNQHIAKVASDYLKKGSKVYLEGELRTRKWTDDKGVEKYVTEVVLPNFGGELKMLDTTSKSGPGYADDPSAYGSTKPVNQSVNSAVPTSAPADLDDEIPL